MSEELKKANKKLVRMAVIVKYSNDAIIKQDLDGNISAWNPAAVEMYGWSEAEGKMVRLLMSLLPLHLY